MYTSLRAGNDAPAPELEAMAVEGAPGTLFVRIADGAHIRSTHTRTSVAPARAACGPRPRRRHRPRRAGEPHPGGRRRGADERAGGGGREAPDAAASRGGHERRDARGDGRHGGAPHRGALPARRQAGNVRGERGAALASDAPRLAQRHRRHRLHRAFPAVQGGPAQPRQDHPRHRRRRLVPHVRRRQARRDARTLAKRPRPFACDGSIHHTRGRAGTTPCTSSTSR